MLYIGLVIILVLFDQISKYEIDKVMFEGDSIPLITNLFHLTYVKNRGIAFGMFQGKLDIISILTIVVIIILIIYVLRNRKKLAIIDKLSYSFIVGGAIGNILDRVIRGYVIDMIDFRGIWVYVFNLADVWINIGIILMIIGTFLDKKGKLQNRRDI